MHSRDARVWRPTPAQMEAAKRKRLADVVAPGLRVLFCGINPSLYSAAVGHHFARPGNRFWPTLFRAGFTDRLLSPFEDRRLLERGIGVTNLVSRATARADELTPEELCRGAKLLERKVRRFKPTWLAVVGVTAYRAAFDRPRAQLGEQEHWIGETRVWVLPNPSGLNAHHQAESLAALYSALRKAAKL